MLTPDISIKNTNFEKLYEFEHGVMEDIFGKFDTEKKDCMVINNPAEKEPWHDGDNEYIRTVVNGNYWCQYIYQLTHEMCHYTLRCSKNNFNEIVRWFEETLCEAISLVALHKSYNDWTKCELSIRDPTYANSLKEYLYNILNDINVKAKRSDGLARCKTLEDLKIVDDNCQEELERGNRFNERDYLYKLFLQNPEKVPCITEYSKFIDRIGLMIDFEKWASESEYPDFIRKISEIQPDIECN